MLNTLLTECVEKNHLYWAHDPKCVKDITEKVPPHIQDGLDVMKQQKEKNPGGRAKDLEQELKEITGLDKIWVVTFDIDKDGAEIFFRNCGVRIPVGDKQVFDKVTKFLRRVRRYGYDKAKREGVRIFKWRIMKDTTK